MAYEIEFSPEAIEHLDGFRKFEQKRIVGSIQLQLVHQPLKESRHRKLLRSNLIATRELRVGEFRVYYDVDEARDAVFIRAIGVKRHNRVFIGGEEADLP